MNVIIEGKVEGKRMRVRPRIGFSEQTKENVKEKNYK